ncbi:MAG: iron-containing alcohol dehydrogenase [Clostridia bacterium]|nr:iron-containing alcohol dehydrogenase [Clostridia bacterium]
MKAVIFNSGLGKRMGGLTEHNHKSMVRLQNGESIFERQLRLLHECGIDEFVVTVGPFKEQLLQASKAPHLAGCQFTFVENPIYDRTNYIYSMFLAKEHITGDLLFMHGDLVFDKALVRAIINSPLPSLGCVNRKKALPEKDFKARIEGGCIREVSVSIFDNNCFAFQPFYKLSASDAAAWVGQVEKFIAEGKDQCYAENAMNEIFPQLSVREFDYSGYYVDEVDTAEDLARVSSEIRRFDFAQQEMYSGIGSLGEIMKRYGLKKAFVVCGVPKAMLAEFDFPHEVFDQFTPNPRYEEVCSGVEKFLSSECDCIVSFGGGSAIDVAKCIKLYSVMDSSKPYIDQPHRFNATKHIAIPTTAGTGSESTRYSVIYYNGVKQSITDDGILPDAYISDASLLKGLPEYHKKSAMLDALCHAVESMWSVNADEESAEYSASALLKILANYRAYLNGDEAAAGEILSASNLAGRAINISQTTAAHAMCYKMTSVFGIAHGHAAALCLPEVWHYIAEHTDSCIDPRGKGHLAGVIDRLSGCFGCDTVEQSIERYRDILSELQLREVACSDEKILNKLSDSVNPERLGNCPVPLGREALSDMYRRIL